MFDSVGRRARIRTEREAGSIFVSLAFNGGLVSAILLAGLNVANSGDDEDAPIEVDYVEVAPPPPPPPPPPPASKPRTEKKTEPKPPTEIKPPDEIADLTPEPPDKPEEPDDESDYGVEGGVPGGVPGGFVEGTGTADPSASVRAVHWSEVQVKTRVSPKMPEAAKQLGITEEKCQLRFFIDEKGVPYDIRVEKCSAVFQESALEAGWQWRFYPMKVENRKIKAQFVLTVIYRLT